MSTEEKIEKQILIATKAFDEALQLSYELPENELTDSFMTDLVAIKKQLKFWLNNKFDRLARQREEN